MTGQLDELLFDPSKGLTILRRGGLVRVDLMPDDRWHTSDLGIQWMGSPDGWSYFVPWSAIEQVIQQP